MNFNIIRPLKSLVRRLVDNSTPAPPKPSPTPAPAATRPAATPFRSEPASPRHNGAHHQNGRGIELPLKPILAGLPLELQARVINVDVSIVTIMIPLEKILSQLSRGVVQISFGELRQAAPGLFTMENDRDRVMVPLPLGEILSRLNPALISCRRVQSQVQVPEDVLSPFDDRNQSRTLVIGPAKPPAAAPAAAAPAAAPPPVVLPPARPAAEPAPEPIIPPARANITFAPTPAPPAAPSPIPLSARHFTRPTQEPPSPLAPDPAPAPAAAAPEESGSLLVNVSSLAEAWPEAIRRELLLLNLAEARVALPVESVELALKQGRIVFSWKTLRAWLRPAPPPAASIHDATVLELPLKVVAPLFLARQKEASPGQKKVWVDSAIPNLFFGGTPPPAGGPPPAAPAPPKPTDTNYYVWDDTSDTVRAEGEEGKSGPSPGTKFVAKYATPNEVVSRAASLEGVAGALVALPDGLMVASRLAPEVNGDTLAAFLPQIFAKISQCTRELRMGELNNVNFTVGNIPWKIFRVNAIFFAAFGSAREPLPTAQLAALAAELDHKAK